MAFQLDAKFFRRSKKVNRAVEITDSQAFIPAVKDQPEIRVSLPNRRLKTMEERQAEIDERMEQVATLEGQIELERKSLLAMVKSFEESGTGASEIVAHNSKLKGLIERRSSLVRPQQWIEELESLTFKDVFASKRDVRKIGSSVFQLKRRVEPISSLYVDLGAAAQGAEPAGPASPAQSLQASAKPKTKEKTAAEAAQGAIIGKRVISMKKPQIP